jgi:hypothetical protein
VAQTTVAAMPQVDIISSDAARTIPALFAERIRHSGQRVAYRQFEPTEGRWCAFTWNEMARLAGRWRAGFAKAGLKRGDRVAVLLRNSVEWVAFDQAALGLGLIVVPLYLADSPRNQADILADARGAAGGKRTVDGSSPVRRRFLVPTIIGRPAPVGATDLMDCNRVFEKGGAEPQCPRM